MKLTINPIIKNRLEAHATLLGMIALSLLAMIITGCDDMEVEPVKDMVYIESNHPGENQNSILAYEIRNGMLVEIAGSPFQTGGTGMANPESEMGVSDLDVPMVMHNQILYAVNTGSNTIAAMKVYNNGTLEPVDGSPFSSAGENPVSLAVRGNKLYVVNKAQDPINGNSMNPSYVVFNIEDNGALSSRPLDLIEAAKGSSPASAYIPENSDLLFGTDFLGFRSEPAVGTLRSFKISSNGALEQSRMPLTIPVVGGALGLQKHPAKNILYVGFPLSGDIGIYSFDNDGALTYENRVASGAAACRIRINARDNRMYTLNGGEGTISVHDISNALAPVSVQKLQLKETGPTINLTEARQILASQPFHIELSGDDYAYVVSQRVTPNGDYREGNMLHILHINAGGSLSEDIEPIHLPVPITARPQGIVIRN